MITRFWQVLGWLVVGGWVAAPLRAGMDAGVAKRDITPDGPIRLTGYASRNTETTEIAQRLWAKAVALWPGDGPPAVLVTVDNCGVCAPITEEVARRVEKKAHLSRDRLVICSSHTHSGPQTRGFAPNIFAADIPAEQAARIERYSDRLTDDLEAVVLAALADRQLATVSWNEGQAGFAKNRRTEGGPVDHALPVLCVRHPDGRPRAIVANYACHCTTLHGEPNHIHGDWAGCAQEELERLFPGATALITIGCGADANPHPRGSVDLARQHGAGLATAVRETLAQSPTSLPPTLRCALRRVDLPFQKLPTTAEWETRAQDTEIVGYHARKRLAQLRDGITLPTALPYVVQTWVFNRGPDDDALALVFLAGEVVVDYAVRLKKETADRRGPPLWITAYANDVPCYIPSRRILAEGGYEAESSLWYYDRPARLAPACEDIVIQTIHELLAPAR
ncbi:MAG: neutral/alkaline non-lysosomal ceramidase N-terminal domain-containing protein [Verrucomicrobiales bacterium]